MASVQQAPPTSRVEGHAGVPPANAGSLFAAHVGSGRCAMVDLGQGESGHEVSFEAFDHACNGVASGLQREGLNRGDRVGILSGNRWEFLAVIFGAMRADCVAVPINLRLADVVVNDILADADVRLVFTDDTNRDRPAPGLRRVSFDDPEYGFSRFLDAGPFDAIVPDDNDPALQPYTSGSTGRPKGVLLGHGGIVWVTQAAVQMRAISADICTMVAAPMFHKNAMQAIKQSLMAGGRAILLPRFDAPQYLRAVEKYRATLLTGVPTMFAMLLQEEALLRELDLSSVTRIGFGSAPASDALFDALIETFPNAVVENNYGVTEGGPIMFGPHPDGMPRPRNSVGYVMAGAEVRLRGGASPDEGTLQVKSPGIMLGYHNLPDQTAARLQDGWFDTGDVMRRDGNGFYYFVGRNDDMFVCSGENVFPGEIESVLEKHPLVAQAAVVPVADDLRGQVPHAFVVAAPGEALSEKDLQDFARQNGPRYAWPRQVMFVSSLPLIGSNKIDRAALSSLAAERWAR